MKAKENLARLFKQPIVEYRDADGRRVPAGTPGARRVRKLSKKWYAKLKHPITGKWRPVPLSPDKGVARQMLARLLAGEEAVRVGLADAWQAHRGEPVGGYVEPFLKHLAEQGDGERHIKDTKRQLNAVLEGCEIKTLGELHAAAARVEEFLTGLDCGPRTKNAYRQAVVSFGKFLWKVRKLLPDNPLVEIPIRPNPKSEWRRKRRALPIERLQQFVEVVKSRPLTNALTAIQKRKWRPSDRESQVPESRRATLLRKGRERALIYATAAATGFREGELSTLRVADLHLDGPCPAIRLGGDRTKNGQDAAIPLAEEMAAALRDWLAESGKMPADNLFSIPGYSSVMRAWKKDLAAAGIPYRDEQGRYFDFHSLRKCLGTFLRLAGVDPAVSMKLMRHSDIRLTMEVYNDDHLAELQPVVNVLPSLKLS